MPQIWTDGTIVYIYKHNGGRRGCGNYSPISLTHIIYKLLAGLIARKLTKITHILTSDAQYGYKEGISTADAVIKVK